MFYDPLTEEVIDYADGRQGIADRVIKAIGDPARRFGEDYLRMLRAVRFAARFGFDIEEKTFGAIRDNARRIRDISAERVFAEMSKMLTGPNPCRSVELLRDTGLLRHILPEVDALQGVEQPAQFHPEGDVFVHTVKTLSLLPPSPSPALAWAALLHDAGKPATMTVTDRIRFNNHHHAGARIAEAALKRLRAPNALNDAVTLIVENHMNFMNVGKMRLSTLKKFLSRETIRDELELHRADCLSSHGELDNYNFVVEKLENFRAEEIKPPPLINGRDLIALGLTPGPLFGKILSWVYDLQLEDRITTREEALAEARGYLERGEKRTPLPALALACLILILYGILSPAPAQPRSPGDFQSFTMMDAHYQGILFTEVYKTLASTRVSYPGLWTPERNAVTAGLLPGRMASDIGWGGLYGSADIDISPGSAGLWIGNFNTGDGFRVSEYGDMIYSWETREFALSGALWATPFNNDVFRGASVAFDADNEYAYNGNPYDGLTDLKSVDFSLNALIRLSDNYHLKLGFRTHNRHIEEPDANRYDNRKLFTDGFTAALVDGKLRTLEFWAQNTFAMNYGDEKSDTVSFGLRHTQGRALSYMRHVLFLGLRAGASVSLPSEINEDAGSFQYIYYMQNLTGAGRALRLSLAAPVIADIDLYRGVRCVLSISPWIYYAHVNARKPPQESVLYLEPQHLFRIGLPAAELSFRGLIGDKFDFALKPSLDSDVFISALEVRYRF
jgi:poly(A) polymerase